MKMISVKKLTKSLSILLLTLAGTTVFAQQKIDPEKKNDFWKDVQFGGGLGLNIGSGFTDITIAPSAIYNFNEYVSLGVGLQGSIVSSKDQYNSTIVGGSLISLFNPIKEVQLSVELEEMNVSTKYQLVGGNNIKTNFWNTGLLVGAGYRMDNVTIGARYNLLFDKDKSVYSDAFMPFVRVYF